MKDIKGQRSTLISILDTYTFDVAVFFICLNCLLITIIHAIILLFSSDLQNNLTFESDTVSEETISESRSPETPEDLQEPEKEPGQEGKKALKRDAATLGTAKKSKKTKLEKFLEMLSESCKKQLKRECNRN